MPGSLQTEGFQEGRSLLCSTIALREGYSEREGLGRFEGFGGKAEKCAGRFFEVIEGKGTFDGSQGGLVSKSFGSGLVEGRAGIGRQIGEGLWIIDLLQIDKFIPVTFESVFVEPEDQAEAQNEEGEVEEDGRPHDPRHFAEGFPSESGKKGAQPDEDDDPGGHEQEPKTDEEGFFLGREEGHGSRRWEVGGGRSQI
jgi:hypothetical protein